MRIIERFSLNETLSYLNGYVYKDQNIERYLLIIGAKSGEIYIMDMNLKKSEDEEYKKIFPIKFHVDKTIEENYFLGKITKALELKRMYSDDCNGLLFT